MKSKSDKELDDWLEDELRSAKRDDSKNEEREGKRLEMDRG